MACAFIGMFLPDILTPVLSLNLSYAITAFLGVLVITKVISDAPVVGAYIGRKSWLLSVILACILAVTIYHISPRVEWNRYPMHGVLFPANDEFNHCIDARKEGDLLVSIGSVAVLSSSASLNVISYQDRDSIDTPLISVTRGNGGAVLNAEVEDELGHLIAKIENGAVSVAEEMHARAEWPDASTVRIYNRESRIVFEARFANPATFVVSGEFRKFGRPGFDIVKPRAFSDGEVIVLPKKMKITHFCLRDCESAFYVDNADAVELCKFRKD